MQFQSVIAVLSLALAASAAPAPNNPSGSSNCNEGYSPYCCNSAAAGSGGLLGLPISLPIADCTSVIGIANPVCSSSQTALCCQSSNSQTGLVNANLQCVNILGGVVL